MALLYQQCAFFGSRHSVRDSWMKVGPCSMCQESSWREKPPIIHIEKLIVPCRQWLRSSWWQMPITRQKTYDSQLSWEALSAKPGKKSVKLGWATVSQQSHSITNDHTTFNNSVPHLRHQRQASRLWTQQAAYLFNFRGGGGGCCQQSHSNDHWDPDLARRQFLEMPREGSLFICKSIKKQIYEDMNWAKWPTLKVFLMSWDLHKLAVLQLELYGQKYQQQAWGPILQQIGDPDQVPEMKALNWLKDKVLIFRKGFHRGPCVRIVFLLSQCPALPGTLFAAAP